MAVPNHNFRGFPFSRSAAGATHDGDADAPMVAGGHTTGPCHKRGRPEDPRSRPNLREDEGSAVAVVRACGQGRRGVRREAGTRAQPRRPATQRTSEKAMDGLPARGHASHGRLPRRCRGPDEVEGEMQEGGPRTEAGLTPGRRRRSAGVSEAPKTALSSVIKASPTLEIS